MKKFFLLFILAAVFSSSGLEVSPSIKGVDDRELRSLLENSSLVFKYQREKIKIPRTLNGWIKHDTTIFRDILESRGYYRSRTKVNRQRSGNSVNLEYHIIKNRPYILKSFRITFLKDSARCEKLMPPISETGIKTDKPLNFSALNKAKNIIRNRLRNNGYPFASIKKTNLTIDHSTAETALEIIVSPDMFARFGRVFLSGLVSVDSQFVSRYVSWKEGDPVSIKKISTTKQHLSETELFSVVRDSLPRETDENGRLPVTLFFKERNHRTVGTSVSLSNDLDLGGKIYWRHRNINSRGQGLNLGIEFSTNALTGDIGTHINFMTTYNIPHFLNPSQSLSFHFKPEYDHTPAYESIRLNISASVMRTLSRAASIQWGINLNPEQVLSENRKPVYGLMSIPCAFHIDNRDNPLNPLSGNYSIIELSPFVDIGNIYLAFFKLLAGYNHYFNLAPSSNSVIIAARIIAGSIYSPGGINPIPTDQRFFAGGGGSIRGYSYQSASPSDSGGITGGLSVAYVNVELRFKPFEKAGFVVFMDAGRAFEKPLFNRAEDISIGSGAGLRIFTSFSPIRLDIGVPVNNWTPINSFSGFFNTVRFYTSLGQAF